MGFGLIEKKLKKKLEIKFKKFDLIFCSFLNNKLDSFIEKHINASHKFSHHSQVTFTLVNLPFGDYIVK